MQYEKVLVIRRLVDHGRPTVLTDVPADVAFYMFTAVNKRATKDDFFTTLGVHGKVEAQVPSDPRKWILVSYVKETKSIMD